MGLSIILTTLLNTTNFTSPDLCADVYADATGQPYTDAIGQTWARFCEWTGPDAPELDLDVCCMIGGDTASCTLPDPKGRCWSGASTRYCEFGEVLATGGVVCYQPFPSACDLGFCVDVQPPGSGPVENGLCCWDDDYCTEVENGQDIIDCATNGGIASFCYYGAQNIDGSVECFD
jgi:hypothetical protein